MTKIVVDLQKSVIDEYFVEDCTDGYYDDLLSRMQNYNTSILSFMAYHVQGAQMALYESAADMLTAEKQDRAIHITEFAKMQLYLEGAKLYDLIDQSHETRGYSVPYASPAVCASLNQTYHELQLMDRLDYCFDALNALRQPFPVLVDFIYTMTDMATDFFDDAVNGNDYCSEQTYCPPSTDVDKMFSMQMITGLTGIATCLYCNEYGLVQRQLLE